MALHNLIELHARNDDDDTEFDHLTSGDTNSKYIIIVVENLTFKTIKMFNQSMILCDYMHFFNNIVLAHAMTAILIIQQVSCFYRVCEKGMCKN